uniref:Uncharacterized protein n=1 Tax=Salix viminalis TaxID=40686 RepID=A0A6N2L337_SALVM
MLSWCSTALAASRAVARLIYAPLASLRTFLFSAAVFLLGNGPNSIRKYRRCLPELLYRDNRVVPEPQ